MDLPRAEYVCGSRFSIAIAISARYDECSFKHGLQISMKISVHIVLIYSLRSLTEAIFVDLLQFGEQRERNLEIQTCGRKI
jgi:hypothetical protein